MAGHRPHIPGGIWALGLVSLCMDTSSELIHSLLPVFLVSVLGASALAVGVIEGIAEATASITKPFSGALSDFLGRRKLLTVLGYGLAAASKPLFPLAGSVGWVFAARVIDRIGKGIRGAPRDALIAEIAPPEMRGACYGLRQALDTVGAFAGPLLAIALMALLADDIRRVFWVAVAPAVLAVAILVVAVREPAQSATEADPATPIRSADLRRIGSAYWWLATIAAVAALGRFSEAFLVLRSQNVGLAIALIPLVMVVMNAVYAGSAYPAGWLSDRTGRRGVVALGFALVIAADIVLALAGNVWTAMLGVALWGLHLGLTQGLLAAMVADAAPKARRGTAFGVFSLISGLAALAASVLAGVLWDRYGPPAPFVAGAAFSILALIGLLVGPKGRSSN